MLSFDVQMMIPRIQAYLGGQPVEKAWLFGSCSRGGRDPGQRCGHTCAL